MLYLASVGALGAFASHLRPNMASARAAQTLVSMAAADEFTLAVLGDLHVSRKQAWNSVRCREAFTPHVRCCPFRSSLL